MRKIGKFINLILGGLIGFIYFGQLGLVIPLNSRISGRKKIQIAKGFGAGSGLWIDAIQTYGNISYSPKIEIGRGVNFGYDCHIGAVGNIKIQDGVLFGSRILVTDHSHGKYFGLDVSNPFETRPIDRPLGNSGSILIEKNVWICDGVVILGGVTIGEGSIVAANSIVTTSISPGVIVGGAPAKVIKKFSKELNQWIGVQL